MADAIPRTESDDEPKRPSSHYALTPAAMDVLRTKAKPRRPDDASYGKVQAVNDTGTAPLTREAPLSPYMISPKYLEHDEAESDAADASGGLTGYGLTGGSAQASAPRGRELQGAGQTFHDTLAMPMSSPLATGRIRRARPTAGREDQYVAGIDGYETENQAEPAQPDRTEQRTAEPKRGQTAALAAAAAGLGAGLAASWTRGRAAMAGGLSRTYGAAAAGLANAHGSITDQWSHLRGRPRKYDYSKTAGARRRGLVSLDPRLPIILPLMVILAGLALGVMTGAFDTFTLDGGSRAGGGNGSTSASGNGTMNQTGGRGAGGTPAQSSSTGMGAANGVGTGTGTGTSTGNGTGTGTGVNSGASTAATNSGGTTGANGANNQTAQGGTGNAPTAPDGTPLPVGGRGGGDIPPVPADAQRIMPPQPVTK